MGRCLCARADDGTERRLGNVRKLYLTISAQMFLSAAVSAAMFFTPAVNTFMATTWGLILLMVLVVVTILGELRS
ncbi:unnamed protein product [Cuscuta campestris]|uniref:Uncharacterized protein n=1 Tax=Cuscuta campestris TaxID=132261 RepID=A0A484MAG0_9ASTE|nr:unnamed protein product [Cuscuta campestris]